MKQSVVTLSLFFALHQNYSPFLTTTAFAYITHNHHTEGFLTNIHKNPHHHHRCHQDFYHTASFVTVPFSRCQFRQSKNDDDESDEDGVNLAADFFKTLQDRNIQLDDDDLLDDEDDDDDDEDEDDDNDGDNINLPRTADEEDDDDEEEEEEEEEINFPQGAINAMTGWDAGGVGDLAGNVTLTNKQVYDELKERCLESAGAFVELVGGADDNENDDDDEEEEDGLLKAYKSPTTVPDSGLTAGEVVTTVLEALLHNDVPTKDRGVEVLFGYSSSTSAIKKEERLTGLTPSEYAEFLQEDEEGYGVLFAHNGVITIDKGDYSADKMKAYFTARLKTGDGYEDSTSVNFVLSTKGHDEDDCWLIDSMLIRPEKMRRRRRR